MATDANGIALGDCRIERGNYNHNTFVYCHRRRLISVSFDNRYQLTRFVIEACPSLAVARARSIVLLFLNKTVTVDQLVAAGFTHNIPPEHYTNSETLNVASQVP